MDCLLRSIGSRWNSAPRFFILAKNRQLFSHLILPRSVLSTIECIFMKSFEFPWRSEFDIGKTAFWLLSMSKGHFSFSRLNFRSCECGQTAKLLLIFFSTPCEDLFKLVPFLSLFSFGGWVFRRGFQNWKNLLFFSLLWSQNSCAKPSCSGRTLASIKRMFAPNQWGWISVLHRSDYNQSDFLIVSFLPATLRSKSLFVLNW